MKTTLFTYETPAGTFWIRPEPAGRVQLGIDRRKLQTYSSVKTAARAVAERCTGYADWDNATGIPAPPGLDRWKGPISESRRSGRERRPDSTMASDPER